MCGCQTRSCARGAPSYWRCRRQAGGPSDQDTASQKAKTKASDDYQLVQRCVVTNQMKQAISQCLLYQRALTIREQQLGEMHPDTARSLSNLAELYRLQGKLAEAEPLYRRALAIYEQQLGDKHPTTQIIQNKYAVLLEAMKQNEEVG